MKLVGATNNFIRWPFFVEGALLGLIGSIIPIAVLLFGYASLVDASRFNLGLDADSACTFGRAGGGRLRHIARNRPCHRNLGQSDFLSINF